MKIQGNRLELDFGDVESFLSYDPRINGFEVADALGNIEYNYLQVEHIIVPERYSHLQNQFEDQWKAFLIKKSNRT
ncbi:hypothetical protein [Paenibacillus kyungheensis]